VCVPSLQSGGALHLARAESASAQSRPACSLVLLLHHEVMDEVFRAEPGFAELAGWLSKQNISTQKAPMDARAAGRPRLSSGGNELLLTLVLQALGAGHYLDVASVCKPWKQAYSTHVQQSPMTCCRHYLQSASLWSYVKEHSLHWSIPATSIGQYGCDAALVDTIGLPYSVQLTAHNGLHTAWIAEMPCASLLSSDSNSELWSPVVQHWQAPDSNNFEADNALHAAHSAFCKTAKVQSQQLVLDVAAGAARGGRFVVFADVLLKWLVRTHKWPNYFQKLQEQLLNALINSAVSCKDTATFVKVLRVLLVLADTFKPYHSMHVRTTISDLKKWHTAAACHEQCDTSQSLKQFTTLIEEQQGCSSGIADKLWDFVGKSFHWALARCGVPVLHSYFIQNCPQAIAEDLVHKVAQKGSVQVLEHILQEGILNENTFRLIVSINNGALEGDKVAVVEWLLSHGLLSNGMRQRLMPCNRKLIAFFTQLDSAVVAEQ
jgi:hypothetical protein